MEEAGLMTAEQVARAGAVRTVAVVVRAAVAAAVPAPVWYTEALLSTHSASRGRVLPEQRVVVAAAVRAAIPDRTVFLQLIF